MPNNTLTFQAETQLPTEFGNFRFLVYKNNADEEVMAIATSGVENHNETAVRVHSACFTAEVVGSLKCDCKQQLDFALEYIAEHGGVVVYLPQEGRGIGLSNKIKAYALQESGHDTIEANSLLGLPIDDRSYEDAAEILKDLNIQAFKLITNNPLKLQAMRDFGFSVKGRVPVPAVTNPHSKQYIETKRQKMGHMIEPQASKLSRKPNNSIPLDRPYVHVNFAIDRAGKMNLAGGQAVNLSCDKDWKRVHELRERYSAVVVGAQTWVLDKPQLTARFDRLGRPPQRQPDRIIFAGNTDCQVAPSSKRVFVIGSPELASKNCIKINSFDHDLEEPLHHLFQHGVESVLVEGGFTLVKSFIEQKMVDRFTIYAATRSTETALNALLMRMPELPISAVQTQALGEGTLLSLDGQDLAHMLPPLSETLEPQAQVI